MATNLVAKIIEDIRRGESNSIDAYLKTIVHAFELNGTHTKFYTHMIAHDGNGGVKLAGCIEFIIRHIIEYVIPRSKIQEAKEKDRKSGLNTHLVRLTIEAMKLFTPLQKTGEGGEMLLFVLGEVLLGLPQLFCKMSLKTARGVHYHGADGIHVGVTADGKLELYWGESKLHKTFSTALSDCLDTLGPILRRENDADFEDLLLLQKHLDLNNPAYTEAVKYLLDKDNVESNSVVYCGLCLIGFDEDIYAKETTAEMIESKCAAWKTSISKKLANSKLEEINIHFFCLPVVCVENFRKTFLQMLGLESLPAPSVPVQRAKSAKAKAKK